MAEPKIVVFGSINQDLISYTNEFPRPGESVRGHSFQMGSGGKGANQAVAAARLGAKVQLIARVGTDIFGKSNVESLTKSGVDTSQVEISDTSHTGAATITVNSHGENCIVIALGANLELDDSAANRHEAALQGASIVLIQAENCPKGNKRIFELAKKHGVKTFFNPAPADPNMDKSIVALTDIICANETETEIVTGVPQHTLDDAKKGAAQTLTMGPEHVIITLGAKGCILASKGQPVEHIPVKKVTAVDTTGAGDCFCGSLAYFIVQGKLSMREAVVRSAGIAALSVQRKGTQSSYWTREEIQREHPDLLK
ncbi:ribokinase [Ancylostoma caninum]|uniref:Ribokinase n=1 Tax=Ancylostoma caninum TaxID=29170 RepID=A0A368GGD4_ANCCA|nr:ribokinase [Ancylostoma caninum]